MATKAQHRQYRQGDVWIEQAIIPEDAAPVDQEGDRIILALGEATGHHHSVPLADAALLARGAERYLRVSRITVLGHQEHAGIQLPAGDYRVSIQREYSDEDDSRAVLD